MIRWLGDWVARWIADRWLTAPESKGEIWRLKIDAYQPMVHREAIERAKACAQSLRPWGHEGRMWLITSVSIEDGDYVVRGEPWDVLSHTAQRARELDL